MFCTLFFFLMIRQQPSSTLFPYTTLFRSGYTDYGELLERERIDIVQLAAPVSELEALTDRKSTRLNSSHTVISYAVFCLKKKKKERLPELRPPLQAGYCRAHRTACAPSVV